MLDFTLDQRKPLPCGGYALDAVALYLATDLGGKRIAKRLGVSPQRITRFFRQIGIVKGKPSPCHRSSPIKRSFNKARADELAKETRYWRGMELTQRSFCQKTRMDRYHEDYSRSRVLANAQKARYRDKWKDNAAYRINLIVRSCMQRIVGRGKVRYRPKPRTLEYLGCDYDCARAHIESQFKPDMNWGNHGKLWEVDHIRPIASFNLWLDADARAAAHFTNLQPLYTKENRMKRDKWMNL